MITERLTFDDITLIVAPVVMAGDDETRRDAERRTVAALVREAFGAGAAISHDASGAPRLSDSDISLSVSHSRNYACIAFSRRRAVGVDIEEPRDQLRRVAPRVLSDEEMSVYSCSDSLLLRAWTLKEALYKAALTPGLDFRADIRLPLDIAAGRASVAGRQFDIVKVITSPDSTLSLVAHPTGDAKHVKPYNKRSGL